STSSCRSEERTILRSSSRSGFRRQRRPSRRPTAPRFLGAEKNYSCLGLPLCENAPNYPVAPEVVRGSAGTTRSDGSLSDSDGGEHEQETESPGLCAGVGGLRRGCRRAAEHVVRRNVAGGNDRGRQGR